MGSNLASVEACMVQIKNAAFELVPVNGLMVAWTTHTIGTFILENDTEALRPPSMSASDVAYYTLNAALEMDVELRHYPVSQTVFNSDGLIFEAASGWLNADCSNNDEINESIAFQVKNKIAAPGDDDYEKVARYLSLGLLDTVRV